MVKLLLAGVSVLAFTHEAIAQAPAPDQSSQPESGQALEEIVVSAQRRAERAQDVPIVVNVVTASDLQAAGVTDSGMLASAVPGLSISAGAAGSFQPHIRGVGTSASGPGIESPIALYVDDVYYGSQTLGLLDMNDVSQVAVLKGPQGTLFGRNATGGVIQLSTRDPQQQFGGEFRTELDSYLTSRSNAFITGGLTDTVAASLSLNYITQKNGWGRNLDTDTDTYRIIRDFAVRTKWVFTPTSSTTIRLAADLDSRGNSMFPVVVPAPGTTPLMPGFTRTSNPYDTDVSVDTRDQGKTKGVSLKLEQSLGVMQLVDIAAYRNYDVNTVFDNSMSPIPAQVTAFRVDGNQFSEELQLLSQASNRLTWVLGLYYFRATDHLPFEDQELRAPAAPVGVNSASIFEDNTTTTNSKAGYGQATLLLVPDTHLTTGIRYTSEKRGISGDINAIFDGFAQSSPPVEQSHKFTSWTWRAALDHNFTSDVLGYVSYDRGFKSGGFNGYNPEDPPYNPEKIDAYEVGLKSEFLDHRLRVNHAVFYNKYSDIQVTSFAALPSIKNGAAAKTYGYDLDVEASVTTQLRVTAGFEWLHAKFTNFPAADTFTEVPALPPPFGPLLILTEASAKDHWLPFAPQYSGNVGADYKTDVRFGTLNFNLSDSFSGAWYGEANNELRQPAYSLLNASVDWTSKQGGLTVGVYGRNLLNKAVANFLGGIQPVGFTTVYAGPPRVFGMWVKYGF